MKSINIVPFSPGYSLTQKQLAEKIGTTQSSAARLGLSMVSPEFPGIPRNSPTLWVLTKKISSKGVQL